MQIKIGNSEYSEIRDGVYCKCLSNFPRISDREMRTIIEFIEY